MTVNWKEVADTLAHALSAATAENMRLTPSALLAYRLACECEAPARSETLHDRRATNEENAR